MTNHKALAARALTYSGVGATCPDRAQWNPPHGFRSCEVTVRVGHGDSCWQAAAEAALAWGIKTRSGFAVEPADRTADWVGPADRIEPADHIEPPDRTGPVGVLTGERYWLVARLGPVTVREPVEVVAVVRDDDRRGFAYGTLEGHPVSGEEAFIVHRGADGTVWLTLRSLTRPGRGRWWALFPAALVAQRWYRRRYLRALAGLRPGA